MTTYAVFPMSSSEVGWFRPSMTTVKWPSRSTFTRAPVFGCAGDPSGFPGWKSPWERAYSRCPRPNSTSTSKGLPDATSRTVVDPGRNATTLPVSGRWGTGPASAMEMVLPRTSSPVGTMLANARSTLIWPSRATRSTRLWWPSLTRNPPR